MKGSVPPPVTNVPYDAMSTGCPFYCIRRARAPVEGKRITDKPEETASWFTNSQEAAARSRMREHKSMLRLRKGTKARSTALVT